MNNKDIKKLRALVRRLERESVEETCSASCKEVTLPQCHILMEMEYTGKSTISELSESMMLDKSTLSRTIESLVKSGLIERTASAGDRRYNILSLTAKGTDKCREINIENDTFYMKAMEKVPEKKRSVVLEGLEIFIEAIEKTRGENI